MARKGISLQELQKCMSPATKELNKRLLTDVVKEKAPKKKKAAKKAADSDPKGLAYIKSVLTTMGIPYVTELRFHEVRMFRFDIAIEDKKISIEYEGIFSGKSRHTTFSGYTRDSVKYNLATTEGWRVLRYTATNYKDFDNDIKKMI